MATESEDLGFIPATANDDLGFVPASAPTVKNDAAQFPRMGQFPKTTALQRYVGDPAAALSYGALQEIGRIPGGIVSLANALERVSAAGQGMAPTPEMLKPNLAQQLEASIQDLTPKAFEAAGVPTTNPTSPQFLHPNLASVGEIVGPPIVLAPEQALKGLVATPKAVASLFSPRTEQAAAQGIYSIINPSKGSRGQDSLNKAFESGDLVTTLKEITREGVPTTGKEAVQFTKQAKDANMQAVREIQAANPDYQLDVSGIRTALLQQADASALTEREANAIRSFADNFSEPLTLKEALDKQVRLNEEWNPSSGISNSSHSLAASQLSEILDGAFKKFTGTDNNPYRRWGKLSELEKGFQKAYNDAFSMTKKGENVGVLSETMQGVGRASLARPGAILSKVGGPIVNAARGRQIGDLDRKVASVFGSIEGAAPIPTASVIAQPPPIPPNVLSQQIQSSIQGLTPSGAPALGPVLNIPPVGPMAFPANIPSSVLTPGVESVIQGTSLSAPPALGTVNSPLKMMSVGEATQNARQQEALIQQLSDALKQRETQALAATPQELPVILNQLANESASLGEARAVQQGIGGTLPKAMSAEAKALLRTDTGELLSNHQHILNTTNDPVALQMIETELQRRLAFKKYSKDFPEIRDALGIGGEGTPSTLPSRREADLVEAIKSSMTP